MKFYELSSVVFGITGTDARVRVRLARMRATEAALLACITFALNGCGVVLGAAAGFAIYPIAYAISWPIGAIGGRSQSVAAERIQRLRDKYDRGEMTEEEYDTRRGLILNDKPAPDDE